MTSADTTSDLSTTIFHLLPLLPLCYAITTQQLIQWKQQGRTIVALTAWDYVTGRLLDAAGVDLILVAP